MSQTPLRQRCAVVGGGWAGLAAAVRATQAGHAVTLYETAAVLGGRARSIVQRDEARDNGQHILIGAYTQTLDLMRSVGVEPNQVLARMPLSLVDAHARGMRLPAGGPLLSFVRGVLGHTQWSCGDKWRLLGQAVGWAVGGFRCEPDQAVAQWGQRLPPAVQRELIEPLCVAALNTPADQASAAVLLRVLRDALFSGPGGADLLLPRRTLGELLPEPAGVWLQQNGARVSTRHRVQKLQADGAGWQLDSEPYDCVVLACSAREAARLSAPHAPAWAQKAAVFAYEPIVTAWISAPGLLAPFPMLALAGEPAQFAFDLGQLNFRWTGQLSLVVSGAARWLEAGPAALESALADQINQQLGHLLPNGWRLDSLVTEKRATFRCTPGLERPPGSILPRLLAAGDYVEGPYPATLEGAVRSGEKAAAAIQT